MKVLVVGGTGFIGPHVVRQLAGMGHSVAVLHRGKTDFDLLAEEIIGDRRDLAVLRPRADVVIDILREASRRIGSIMRLRIWP